MLDARHDKMERIVKLSRDITIESKRIIFTLHRLALPKILYKVRYSGYSGKIRLDTLDALQSS